MQTSDRPSSETLVKKYLLLQMYPDVEFVC